jgi:hypothetical protein
VAVDSCKASGQDQSLKIRSFSMANDLLFSRFIDQEFPGIYQVLSEVFLTSDTELSGLYQKMAEDFDKVDWPPANFVSRTFFKSADDSFQEIYNKSPVVAVDLPSLLELDDGKEHKPTVVILGQDSKSDRDCEGIRIGTPYALHVKGCREILKRTKLYFDMVYVLLELGYRVYLTDIFKVWVCNPERPYYGARLPKVDRSRFIKVLKSELQIVKPTALITWGNDAARSASAINLDFHHLKFLHPGGAANGAWKKLLGKSPTHVNKLEYWKKEIIKISDL